MVGNGLEISFIGRILDVLKDTEYIQSNLQQNPRGCGESFGKSLKPNTNIRENHPWNRFENQKLTIFYECGFSSSPDTSIGAALAIPNRLCMVDVM